MSNTHTGVVSTNNQRLVGAAGFSAKNHSRTAQAQTSAVPPAPLVPVTAAKTINNPPTRSIIDHSNECSQQTTTLVLNEHLWPPTDEMDVYLANTANLTQEMLAAAPPRGPDAPRPDTRSTASTPLSSQSAQPASQLPGTASLPKSPGGKVSQPLRSSPPSSAPHSPQKASQGSLSPAHSPSQDLLIEISKLKAMLRKEQKQHEKTQVLLTSVQTQLDSATNRIKELEAQKGPATVGAEEAHPYLDEYDPVFDDLDAIKLAQEAKRTSSQSKPEKPRGEADRMAVDPPNDPSLGSPCTLAFDFTQVPVSAVIQSAVKAKDPGPEASQFVLGAGFTQCPGPVAGPGGPGFDESNGSSSDSVFVASEESMDEGQAAEEGPEAVSKQISALLAKVRSYRSKYKDTKVKLLKAKIQLKKAVNPSVPAPVDQWASLTIDQVEKQLVEAFLELQTRRTGLTALKTAVPAISQALTLPSPHR